MPNAPAANDLDKWDQEFFSLSVGAATTLGFPLGNVSASVKHQSLLFGLIRWKNLAEGQYTYRFGVALREIVPATDIKADGELTLLSLSMGVKLTTVDECNTARQRLGARV
jgi:hypothetical protein